MICPNRNVYDQAGRMLGVRMVDVKNKEEYEAAFSPRTAMVYTSSGTVGLGVDERPDSSDSDRPDDA